MSDAAGKPSAGPIALHGGGEFLPGDEPFLHALLALAARSANRPIRAVVVPTAAARQRPDLAAAHGVEALRRVSDEAGLDIDAAAVMVVDARSASDSGLSDQLRSADLVYLPGGDPDLVPAVLRGSSAWSAVEEASARGALVAGASAGAMGLAILTWTPRGFVPGLGLVERLVVVPHFEQYDPRGREADARRVRDEGLGVLGLDERTGAIRHPDGSWHVAGAGRAVWIPSGGGEVVGRHGDRLPIHG